MSTMKLCRLRVVAFQTVAYSRGLVNTPRSLLSCVPVAIAVFDRGAHTQHLTKDMLYISNDKQTLKLDPSTLKLDQSTEKPLCIMMLYLMAKRKHVLKYADLYLKHGFDVIAVSCTPSQVMWPVKGSQVIADRLLTFLESNKCGSGNPLVVHGFSVGAYVWAELLVKTTRNKERYIPVLDRITAQVWDSPADVDDVSQGVPFAMFPNNKVIQKICMAYIEFNLDLIDGAEIKKLDRVMVSAHMKVLYNITTKHYVTATKVYHASPCRAPGLFLVSKTDPIGVESNSRRAAASWNNLGIKSNVKCWDKSPHVQHYSHYPEEYKTTLYTHLAESGCLKNNS